IRTSRGTGSAAVADVGLRSRRTGTDMSEIAVSVATGRIVIADDQRTVLGALTLLLKGEGYEVTAASSPDELVGIVERSEFDVALVDLNYTRDTTSGQEGFALLDRLKAADP